MLTVSHSSQRKACGSHSSAAEGSEPRLFLHPFTSWTLSPVLRSTTHPKWGVNIQPCQPVGLLHLGDGTVSSGTWHSLRPCMADLAEPPFFLVGALAVDSSRFWG